MELENRFLKSFGEFLVLNKTDFNFKILVNNYSTVKKQNILLI